MNGLTQFQYNTSIQQKTTQLQTMKLLYQQHRYNISEGNAMLLQLRNVVATSVVGVILIIIIVRRVGALSYKVRVGLG